MYPQKLDGPTGSNSIAPEQKTAAPPLHKGIKAKTKFDLLSKQIYAILNIVTVKRVAKIPVCYRQVKQVV